jgi:hypothetical protein
MRLSLDRALLCLQLLTEGNSIRSTVRISGVAKDTVIALLICVGEKCETFLRNSLRAVEAKDVQSDEIWGFVGMKEKTKARKQLTAPDFGDAYCFVAIERMSKLILAWYLGKRDAGSANAFLVDVERSTRGRIQISTDGFNAYRKAVQLAFAEREVDHDNARQGIRHEGRSAPLLAWRSRADNKRCLLRQSRPGRDLHVPRRAA